MGLQTRVILQALQGQALRHALGFAGTVLAVVIGVRFFLGHVVRLRAESVRSLSLLIICRRCLCQRRAIGVLVSWCGMRGLVTLATATLHCLRSSPGAISSC